MPLHTQKTACCSFATQKAVARNKEKGGFSHHKAGCYVTVEIMVNHIHQWIGPVYGYHAVLMAKFVPRKNVVTLGRKIILVNPFLQHEECETLRKRAPLQAEQWSFDSRTSRSCLPQDLVTPSDVMRCDKRGKMPRAPNRRGAPKSANNVASTFFNTVQHLLPKDLRFEHGGANLSCPGRHLPLARPWPTRYLFYDHFIIVYPGFSAILLTVAWWAPIVTSALLSVCWTTS